MKAAFTFVSTFAGCGGSSLGYTMAGGKCLLAVEWDAHAVETYRANFPSTDVYHGDIAKLSVEEVLRRTALEPGQLDILDGSPPCQGFSTTGSRDFHDSRNSLFREYVRLLRGLRPKVFVMENVSGMVKGKMKLIFAEAMKELKASGYRVSCRLMNAMYFGVPQSRERIIFIGVREDLNRPPSHPSPRTRPVTVREAFKGLSDVPAERVHLTSAHKTFQQMLKVLPGNLCAKHFSHHRLSWQRPAPTVLNGHGGTAYHIWHPSEQRTITISELKRLASFPDGFIFPPGRLSALFTRVGNSVPPLLARAVAEHIRDNLLSGARMAA